VSALYVDRSRRDIVELDAVRWAPAPRPRQVDGLEVIEWDADTAPAALMAFVAAWQRAERLRIDTHTGEMT
jgi:hypothetical protein